MSFEYLEAAKAVRRVVKGESNTKNAIFNSGARNIKRVYALVTETLKHRTELEAAMRNCNLHKSDGDWSLLLVLAYELFYGAGKIKGGGHVKRLLIEQESRLRELLGVAAKPRLSPLEAAAADLARKAADTKPRWLRVNTCKTTVEDVITRLTGPWTGESTPSAGASSAASSSTPGAASSSAGGDSKAKPAVFLDPSEVVREPVVHTVLRLPPGSHTRLSLHSHPLVTSGHVIMQDLASAMPVAALLQGWDWRKEIGGDKPFDAIDCCAAPGNKTTQLAAALQDMFKQAGAGTGQAASAAGSGQGKKNKGKAQAANSSRSYTVHAFDRDPKRLALLQSRVAAAGAESIIQAQCKDFLSLDPKDPAYARVKVIVLDPSCSGSGMEQPQDSGAGASSSVVWPPSPPASQAGRVQSLAEFQTKALLHALCFPNLRRIVYSTCSLYAEEDERVVAAVLKAVNGEEAGAAGTSSASRPAEDRQDDISRPAAMPAARRVRLLRALPSWPRRGVPGHGLSPADADCCVRCDPKQDGTTGFFLAVLTVDK